MMKHSFLLLGALLLAATSATSLPYSRHSTRPYQLCRDPRVALRNQVSLERRGQSMAPSPKGRLAERRGKVRHAADIFNVLVTLSDRNFSIVLDQSQDQDRFPTGSAPDEAAV